MQLVRLRRDNQILTIQGSLAIEGNYLTVEQITTVLEDKPLIAGALFTTSLNSFILLPMAMGALAGSGKV